MHGLLRYSSPLAASVVALAIAGCGDSAEPPDEPNPPEDPPIALEGRCLGGDDPTKSITLLIDDYDIVIPEAGASLGVDLDGVDGSDETGLGCGIDDLVGVDGTPGVDNALGPIWGTFIGILGEAMAQGLQQSAIFDGRVLMLLRLEGVDDYASDDCVDLRTLTGNGAPLIGTDGRLLPYQTFGIDSDRSTSFAHAGSIDEGTARVRAEVVKVEANLGRYTFVAAFRDAVVEIALDEDGATGVLSGGLDTDFVVRAAQEEAQFSEASSLVDAIPMLVEASADLAPDAAGKCTQISSVITFDAIPVFVASDAPSVEEEG